MPMKTILVAVDLKPTDKKLLKYTIDLAKAFQSRVYLLHVSAPEPDFVGYEVGPQYIRDFRAEELKTEHKTIQSYARSIEEEGILVEALLIQGATKEMLKSEAEKLNAELLIAGHKKHGFLFKLIYGSVSEDLQDDMDIPVLTIPISEE